LNVEIRRAAQEVLGYLNFSSGASDPKVLRNLNRLFAELGDDAGGGEPTWKRLGHFLSKEIESLEGSSPAFENVAQAREVLRLVFEKTLPGYREFHRDLLFHQSDEALFGPLFLGRMMEVVLQQGAPWEEDARIVPAAIAALNDFVGYRPVPVLNSAAKIETYPHERVRPIPLYVEGVGCAPGPYAPILERALALLRQTDPALLREAGFDLECVREICLDPRAYDFDHPANKRPNYHFGEWDARQIDNRGHYHRFVLRQVTLDALLARVEETPEHREERTFEAGAVLAGVILMASGMSGGGPGALDSSVTLGNLVPRIAAFRDAFYEAVLAKMIGEHARHLREEAARLRQPFGGARQHLNYYLARRRAEQLQHVHLARLFARMGYGDAARRQAQLVAVPAARFKTEIATRLSLGGSLLARGQIEPACRHREEVDDLLQRAIQCGAIVDPWNILGFQANFPLFQALENAIHDQRVDELIDLMAEIFGLDARLQCQAAILRRDELRQRISRRHKELAQWWDQFASGEVSGIQHVSGADSWRSATAVADVLAEATGSGQASSQIAFWRKHVGQLQSPKAYALVVSALLDRAELAPAMALLMQWLSEHDRIPLEQPPYSFHELALRWMSQVIGNDQPAADRWALVRRFFDFAEANAEGYWQAPRLQEDAPAATPPADPDEDTFQAAYEGVTYRDSTADGLESSLLESGPSATELELEDEARQITQHLGFLLTIARLWKLLAVGGGLKDLGAEQIAAVTAWRRHARRLERDLSALLVAIQSRPIPLPSGSQESLIEFDRRRLGQQVLLERVVAAIVVCADAARHLGALAPCTEAEEALDEWEKLDIDILAALRAGDKVRVRDRLADLRQRLEEVPLLYRPLASGGDAGQVVKVQKLQHLLADLTRTLPRLGLLSDACDVLVLGQKMELSHPAGAGAISEFDRLFQTAFTALVQSIVDASANWTSGASPTEDRDAALIGCLEPLTEKLLERWILHSRALRLSVLEKVMDEKDWRKFVDFIQRFGRDCFTQSFFHVGNLRAILHQGVDAWLRQLEEREDPDRHFALLDALDRSIPRKEAIAHLEVVIEAVLEHYGEYKDYNGITTQSDRGEMLYVLFDFLRLKVRYDRVAWNLRPVFFAHEVLVRAGRMRAADAWERTFRARTQEAADWHQKRLAELVRKYGLKLPSVTDRIEERFLRPLAIDRARALIQPAMDEARQGKPGTSFALLEHQIGRFTDEPGGAGWEAPPWLAALEREVEEAENRRGWEDFRRLQIPQAPLTYEQIAEQLDPWQPDEP
jgi:hypothetical protein